MSYSLQLSSLSRVFSPSAKSSDKKSLHPLILCCSKSSVQEGEQENRETEKRRIEGQARLILVERYSNGTAKRYMIDDDSQLHTFLEEPGSVRNRFQGSHITDPKLSWLPDTVKDFILPADFPGSVSDDYLEYMLLQFPTNVVAWICHTLVTSSLLQACQSNSGD